MEQIGIVKSIRKGRAEVEIKRISGCGGGCKTCGGCDTPSHSVIIKNDLDAKIGDTVEIKGEIKDLMKYTMIVYFIPFAFLLLGIFGSFSLLKASGVKNFELISFAIGIVTMAMGLVVVRLIDNSVAKKDEDAIRMTRII